MKFFSLDGHQIHRSIEGKDNEKRPRGWKEYNWPHVREGKGKAMKKISLDVHQLHRTIEGKDNKKRAEGWKEYNLPRVREGWYIIFSNI